MNLDGHDYTVMYQNQLPNITVAWPKAPSANSFTLTVESRNGVKRFSTATPSYSFKSGAFLEGHHTIYFDGGNKTSRHTGVDIAFDNAAPMASLVTPTSPEIDAKGDITIAACRSRGGTSRSAAIRSHKTGSSDSVERCKSHDRARHRG